MYIPQKSVQQSTMIQPSVADSLNVEDPIGPVPPEEEEDIAEEMATMNVVDDEIDDEVGDING